MDLKECREKLDKIDSQLIELFRERMEVSLEVARYKSANGLPTYDPVRESKKLESVAAALPPEISGYGRELFRTLMDLGKDYQRSLGAASSEGAAEKNIVLIGMPGSGKSSVGAMLAKLTGRPLYDSDTIIEEREGRTPREIFVKDGEDALRDRECRVLAELGTLRGAVITTGGGCVLRRANYDSLHPGGVIFWLKRDPEELGLEGRPVLRGGSASELYREREPLYRSFADLEIDSGCAPEECAETILKAFGGARS
ncbi:MAG: chorismate mutase [Firmicutes bacterium]|nr:chorismate mutase [Bacillota bacterium]